MIPDKPLAQPSASISEVYPNLTTATHFRNGFTEIIDHLIFLTCYPLGNFSCFFVVCRFFLKINFFEKKNQEYHQCQTVWIQTRPDILSGLIWVQTVCKGYQLRRQRVKLSEYITHYKASKYMYECIFENYFCYFSTEIYVVGTQKNCLNEAVLLST